MPDCRAEFSLRYWLLKTSWGDLETGFRMNLGPSSTRYSKLMVWFDWITKLQQENQQQKQLREFSSSLNNIICCYDYTCYLWCVRDNHILHILLKSFLSICLLLWQNNFPHGINKVFLSQNKNKIGKLWKENIKVDKNVEYETENQYLNWKKAEGQGEKTCPDPIFITS